MFKYGTLIGARIKPLYCLSQIMKFEQAVIVNEFHLNDLYSHCVSCDRPRMIDGVPHNCSCNGMPACGSGLQSYWAQKMIGKDEMTLRKFYQVDDKYEAYMPDHLKSKKIKIPDINSIINRILLPEDKLENLRNLIKSYHT
jgi:hypothetical protein